MKDNTTPHINATTGSVIAQEIRKGIAEGRYKTGEKVKEADLCKQFGVSRTPVREAFRLLQNEGLLVYTPQRGVQIPQFNTEEVLNVLQVRTVLECLSARNAAPLATEADIKMLREINSRIRDYHYDEPRKTDTLDREFHMAIARIGNNSYVPDFLQNVMTRYEISSYVIPIQPERIPYTCKEHEDIIAALEMNDAVLAERYMSIHFYYSELSNRKKIKKYIEQTTKTKKKQ